MDASLVSFVNIAVFRSLRTFRVARLLRLMHGRTGVIALLNTLWLSIPALLNVAALLALLFTLCVPWPSSNDPCPHVMHVHPTIVVQLRCAGSVCVRRITKRRNFDRAQ